MSMILPISKKHSRRFDDVTHEMWPGQRLAILDDAGNCYCLIYSGHGYTPGKNAADLTIFMPNKRSVIRVSRPPKNKPCIVYPGDVDRITIRAVKAPPRTAKQRAIAKEAKRLNARWKRAARRLA